MVINCLKWEYGLILLAAVIWFAVANLSFLLAKSKDFGLAVAFILAYVRFGWAIVGTVISCILHPIWILALHGSDFLAITPVLMRLLCFAALLVPMVVSLIILLFGRKISEYIDFKKHHDGKGVYTVDPENYRSPGEFKRELESRGLYYSDDYEELLMQINGKYQDFSKGVYGFNFFPKATITTLRQEKYRDREFENLRIHPDSEKKAPAYLYNALLIRPDGSDSFRYAPIEYTRHERYPQKVDPIYTDYFVCCKIAYVDGDIYAILGVGESKKVEEHYGMFDKSFCAILSEKKNITTYFEGKYFPYGGIHIGTNGFDMLPNRRAESYGYPQKPVNYPVRVVERLNVDAINQAAAELLSGILQE